MTHRRTNIQTFKNSSRLRKNQTEAESRLWQILRARRLNDFRFRRQSFGLRFNFGLAASARGLLKNAENEARASTSSL